jgi:hypothetical protein
MGKSMGNIYIKSYTLQDLDEKPTVLEKYSDPYGYISGINLEGIKKLKENPYSSKDDLVAILAIDESTIIGKLNFYAGIVNLENKKEQILWLSGFFLDDNYKTTGAGGMIMLRALNCKKPLLASGAPDMNAQNLYKGVGFKELGPLRRFVYFYRGSTIAKKYFKNKFFSGLFAIIINPCLKIYYIYKILSNKKQYIHHYRPVKKFDEQIDELYDNEKRNHFPRDSKTLNWILENKKYYAFEIYKKNEIIGYCLLQEIFKKEGGDHNLPSMTVGCLKDYYLADTNISDMEDLILFCINFFKKKKVDIFECQIQNGIMTNVCSKYGLYEIGGNKVLFRPKGGKTLKSDTPWFFTYGSGDVILCD